MKNIALYLFLDYCFLFFHAVLIVFNLTGWLWPTTRRLHLTTISLTLLSWFGLGLFFGWGYCPSTDYHWQIKRLLGETDLHSSYLKHYADRLTGQNWDPLLVDILALTLTLTALVLSCILNWRDHNNRRKPIPDQH